MGISDLTTFTEVDPNSHIAVTALKADVNGMTRGETAYLYKDMGVDFFDGDLSWFFDVTPQGHSGIGITFLCGAQNLIGDVKDVLEAGNEYYLGCRFLYSGAGNNHKLQLIEIHNGTMYGWDVAPVVTIAEGTTKYINLIRDEAVGASGTAYLHIYNNSDYTGLLATIPLTLHEKADLRYAFVAETYDDGNGTLTLSADIENVDVGEDTTNVNVDPGPVGLTTSLTGEATAEGIVDVDPGPLLLIITPTAISPENDSVMTLTTSLEGVVLSAHIDCDSIPLTTSLTGYRLECDPIVVTISVEGQSADITVLPDPIEIITSLHGDYSEFITMTPIEVTLGLTGGYAHEYIVIATPIEIGTTLTADWPNVLVSPGPIPLTTRLLGEGVITDKAEIILYFYSNGQLITTKTIPLAPAITGQEWLRTRFPIELKGRHLSVKVECTGSNRETYLYDYGLDLRILNER